MKIIVFDTINARITKTLTLYSFRFSSHKTILSGNNLKAKQNAKNKKEKKKLWHRITELKPVDIETTFFIITLLEK